MPTLPHARVVRLAVAGAVLVPALLAVKCDPCKRHPERCAVDSDTDVDTQHVTLERKLQVSRMVPDTVEPNTGFTADVLGAGLEPRSTVAIGPFAGSNVTQHSSARLSVDVPALPAGRYDLTVTNPDGEEVTLTRALTVAVKQDDLERCRELTLYFGFDDDDLESESRDALDRNVSCYNAASGRIRVEGHADERGTIDYNLALGQRRADAVQRYLISQTVPVTRLRTVSYGEERPADLGHSEASWAKNRRAVVVLED